MVMFYNFHEIEILCLRGLHIVVRLYFQIIYMGPRIFKGFGVINFASAVAVELIIILVYSYSVTMKN
jgi:hypothetical protein